VAGVTKRHLERARRPFPREPVRTLDALHLACLLSLRDELPEIAVVSLDGRIRTNADALGFDLRPVKA
jgi:hypothetical protein